jgi:hypothetical protein
MNRTLASRGGTDRELVPLPETLIAYSAKDVGMDDSQPICAVVDGLDGRSRFHNASHASDWAHLRLEFAARNMRGYRRVGSGKLWLAAYMRCLESRGFLRAQHFSTPTPITLTRAHVCIHGTAAPSAGPR